MGTSNNVDEVKNRVLTENTSQAVFKHLRKLEDHKEQFQCRWVWELLQNARDAARLGDGAKVELVLGPQELLFRHDGKAFSEEEVAHLVYHGSTKLATEKAVGQFGSGFLSTHLISKTVRVRGHLKKGDEFDFVLERHGNSPQELAQTMDESWQRFKDSRRSTSQNDTQLTEFAYHLEPIVKTVVEQGIEALQRHAPYVLAFNDALGEIHLDQRESVSSIRKGTPEELRTGIALVPIERQPTDEERGRIQIALACDDDVCVAVLLRLEAGETIVELDQTTPRIFVAFPLLGTEDFCFPAIMHSDAFVPEEERDGIPLKGESETNTRNQEAVKRGFELHVGLIEVATARGWLKAHRMLHLPPFAAKTWLDRRWYRDIVADKLVDSARSREILKTIEGKTLTPQESWVPMSPKVPPMDLWNLGSRLSAGLSKLPQREDAEEWTAILLSWSEFIDDDLAALPEAFTIEKLALHVSGMTELNSLGAGLVSSEPVAWLGEFYDLISRAGEISLLDKFELLPDQNGTLRKRVDLQRDDDVDEDLKSIASQLGLNVKSELLHQGISHPEILGNLRVKSESEVLTTVAQRLNERCEQDPSEETVRHACVSLFWWVVARERLADLQGLPVLTSVEGTGENQIIPLRRLAHDEERIPLAPPSCWPEKARPFAGLFPRRFILSSEYTEECGDKEPWRRVADEGYVRLSPVYDKTAIVEAFIDVDTDSEQEQHHSDSLVRGSDIAFLTGSGGSIIDTVRGSKAKGRELLHFLISFVLAEDDEALAEVESVCTCSETHRHFRAFWLTPIKVRKWVRLDKTSSLPTAKSLAQLLEDKTDLIDMLRMREAARLMKALGISMADLSLRSISGDEDERFELDSSLARMVGAAHSGPTRIHELADEISECPEALDWIRERRKKREDVRKNQEVGQAVETLLRQHLESLGFHVERTGIGSDFEIAYEHEADEVDIRVKVSGKGKSFLIEVKATVDMTAKMTEKQASTAVEEKDSYLLCIVNRSPGGPLETQVREGARFVHDIGERLGNLWSRYRHLQETRNITPTRDEDIELEMDQGITRFRVGAAVYATGLNFDELVELIGSCK